MTSRHLAAGSVALACAVALAACSKTGNNASSDTTAGRVDTMVSSHTVRDTTVVKADTTVHVDTLSQTHHAPDSVRNADSARKADSAKAKRH